MTPSSISCQVPGINGKLDVWMGKNVRITRDARVGTSYLPHSSLSTWKKGGGEKGKKVGLATCTVYLVVFALILSFFFLLFFTPSERGKNKTSCDMYEVCSVVSLFFYTNGGAGGPWTLDRTRSTMGRVRR